MKKVVFGILILMAGFSVCGQSVDKTIEWMNEKFVDIKDDYKGRYKYDYFISLNDGILNIADRYYVDGSIRNTHIFKAPVLNLDENNIEITSNNVGEIDIDIHTITTGNTIGYDVFSGYHSFSEVIDSFSGGLDDYNHFWIFLPNTIIAERFEKAFTHLIITAKEEARSEADNELF